MPKYTKQYLEENDYKIPPEGFEYESKPPSKKERIGILIANTFLPGSGSLYYGFTYNDRYYKIVGFIQVILAGILIGFFWSIGSGIAIFNHMPAIVPALAPVI